MKKFVLYATSFVPDLIGYVFAVFLRIFFADRWKWMHGVLWVELADPKKKFRGWFARVPFKDWGATTLGHTVMMNHGHLSRVLDATPAQIRAVEGKPLRLFERFPEMYNLAWSLGLILHELTHVEAYEAEAFQNAVRALSVAAYAFATGSRGAAYLAMIWYLIGGVTAFLSANAVAWLRGEEPYSGSHLEEAARMRVTCRRNPELAFAAA